MNDTDRRLERLTVEVASMRLIIEDLVAMLSDQKRSWEGNLPEDRTVDGVLIGQYQKRLFPLDE